MEPVSLPSKEKITLANLQVAMAGEAEKAGFSSEEDVVSYIKDLRKAKTEEDEH
ncbi:MAG: hypothetical protein IKS91_01315 [Spirochaetia bacterium]|nr:hypothetical protein [Spirochaetia bacterium]